MVFDDIERIFQEDGMQHCSPEDIARLRAIDPCRTTGLDSDCDEILQIAIVDGRGELLLNEFVKPARHSFWPSAQKLTGISPSDVADKPPLEHHRRRIAEALRDIELLVGYNLRFDLGFLRAAGINVPRCQRFDVMREYARVARIRGRDGRYLWRPLHECARHYGVEFVPHDALSDIRATMLCFERMLRDDGTRYRVPGTIPYLKAIERRFC